MFCHTFFVWRHVSRRQQWMQLSSYHTYIRVIYSLSVGFRLATADIFQTAGSWILERCNLVLFILKFHINVSFHSKRHWIFMVTNNILKIRHKIIPRCLRTSALAADCVQHKITFSFIRTAVMPAFYDYLWLQEPTEMFLVSVFKDGERTIVKNLCVWDYFMPLDNVQLEGC